jgi:sec-independent protein translocase protein TatB
MALDPASHRREGEPLLGISGPELLVIALVAVVIIGPARLPEYTRSLVGWVRQLRRFVDSSKETMEKDMGLSMDELKKYDPRQYDPRRIVREAWEDTTAGLPDGKDLLPSAAGAAAAGASAKRKSSGAGSTAAGTRSSRAKKAPVDDSTPFDDEST